LTVNYDPPPSLHLQLSDDNGWKIGAHQVAASNGSAAATVVYEIRYAPLPDLRPVAIRVEKKDEREHAYICATVENIGTRASPGAQIFMTRAGQATSTAWVSTLGPGETGEECAETGPFAPGVHTLGAVVDAPDQLVEVNETNNEFSTRYAQILLDNLPLVDAEAVTTQDPAGPPSGPAMILDSTPRGTIAGEPESKPQARADLVVESISLRGGKNDCDPGKNDVRVKVKNQGAADAADIVVKLVVANNPDVSLEKLLKKLDAGESDTVDFDDVSIKSGERNLTASVDAAGAVGESQEDNNTRSVTLTCKDE
jgi:subtilase family serine protease